MEYVCKFVCILSHCLVRFIEISISSYVIALILWLTRSYWHVGLSVLWDFLVHGYRERANNHGVVKLTYITRVSARPGKTDFYKTF